MPKIPFEFQLGDFVQITTPRIARVWRVERVDDGRAYLFRITANDNWVKVNRPIEHLTLIERGAETGKG